MSSELTFILLCLTVFLVLIRVSYLLSPPNAHDSFLYYLFFEDRLPELRRKRGACILWDVIFRFVGRFMGVGHRQAMLVQSVLWAGGVVGVWLIGCELWPDGARPAVAAVVYALLSSHPAFTPSLLNQQHYTCPCAIWGTYFAISAASADSSSAMLLLSLAGVSYAIAIGFIAISPELVVGILIVLLQRDAADFLVRFSVLVGVGGLCSLVMLTLSTESGPDGQSGGISAIWRTYLHFLRRKLRYARSRINQGWLGSLRFLVLMLMVSGIPLAGIATSADFSGGTNVAIPLWLWVVLPLATSMLFHFQFSHQYFIPALPPIALLAASSYPWQGGWQLVMLSISIAFWIYGWFDIYRNRAYALPWPIYQPFPGEDRLVQQARLYAKPDEHIYFIYPNPHLNMRADRMGPDARETPLFLNDIMLNSSGVADAAREFAQFVMRRKPAIIIPHRDCTGIDLAGLARISGVTYRYAPWTGLLHRVDTSGNPMDPLPKPEVLGALFIPYEEMIKPAEVTVTSTRSKTTNPPNLEATFFHPSEWQEELAPPTANADSEEEIWFLPPSPFSLLLPRLLERLSSKDYNAPEVLVIAPDRAETVGLIGELVGTPYFYDVCYHVFRKVGDGQLPAGAELIPCPRQHPQTSIAEFIGLLGKSKSASGQTMALFGAGQFARKKVAPFFPVLPLEPVAILDENPERAPGKIDGVPVLALSQFDFDRVDFIAVASDKMQELMAERLLQVGVEPGRVLKVGFQEWTHPSEG